MWDPVQTAISPEVDQQHRAILVNDSREPPPTSSPNSRSAAAGGPSSEPLGRSRRGRCRVRAYPYQATRGDQCSPDDTIDHVVLTISHGPLTESFLHSGGYSHFFPA